VNEEGFVNLKVKYIDINTTGCFFNINALGNAQIDVDITPLYAVLLWVAVSKIFVD
jgi:hypothetical protein